MRVNLKKNYINTFKAKAPVAVPPPVPAHVKDAAEIAKAEAEAAAKAVTEAKFHLYGLLLRAHCKGDVPKQLTRSTEIVIVNQTPPEAGLVTKYGLLSSVKSTW